LVVATFSRYAFVAATLSVARRLVKAGITGKPVTTNGCRGALVVATFSRYAFVAATFSR